MRHPRPALVCEETCLLPERAAVSAEFQRACVAFFGDLVEVLGVARSVGQIYGLLFSSPQPLSFTDIAGTLDISRGSTSLGLQMLRSLGAVRRVSGDHGRRELFEPELRLRLLVSGLLREKVTPVVTEGAAQLKTLRVHAASARNEAGRKFAAERIQKLESWRRQTRLLLPLLKTILGPKRG